MTTTANIGSLSMMRYLCLVSAGTPSRWRWVAILVFLLITAGVTLYIVYCACQGPGPHGYNLVTGSFTDFGPSRKNIINGVIQGLPLGLMLGGAGAAAVGIVRLIVMALRRLARRN